MRCRRSVCALYICLIAAQVAAQTPAVAQGAVPQLVPPPDWAVNDLSCAPSVQTEKRSREDEPALRVIGAQETSSRMMMGPQDVLVISGGSGAGLEPGQRYYVRRLVTTHSSPKPIPKTVHTAGWVQILGVDATIATATVLHACDGILLDDYLEPYTAPMIAAAPVPGTVPQYDNMGRVVSGAEGMHTGGAGNLMTIDRGSNAGVVVGQRFLVFRDKREERVETMGRSAAYAASARQAPLVELGELLVVSVRPTDATVQVVRSKDAVMTGDLVAPIR